MKFPTKRVSRIFHVLNTKGMAPIYTSLWNDRAVQWSVTNCSEVRTLKRACDG